MCFSWALAFGVQDLRTLVDKKGWDTASSRECDNRPCGITGLWQEGSTQQNREELHQPPPLVWPGQDFFPCTPWRARGQVKLPDSNQGFQRMVGKLSVKKPQALI